MVEASGILESFCWRVRERKRERVLFNLLGFWAILWLDFVAEFKCLFLLLQIFALDLGVRIVSFTEVTLTGDLFTFASQTSRSIVYWVPGIMVI